jgi:hypothetical protein
MIYIYQAEVLFSALVYSVQELIMLLHLAQSALDHLQLHILIRQLREEEGDLHGLVRVGYVRVCQLALQISNKVISLGGSYLEACLVALTFHMWF